VTPYHSRGRQGRCQRAGGPRPFGRRNRGYGGQAHKTRYARDKPAARKARARPAGPSTSLPSAKLGAGRPSSTAVLQTDGGLKRRACRMTSEGEIQRQLARRQRYMGSNAEQQIPRRPKGGLCRDDRVEAKSQRAASARTTSSGGQAIRKTCRPERTALQRQGRRADGPPPRSLRRTGRRTRWRVRNANEWRG